MAPNLAAAPKTPSGRESQDGPPQPLLARSRYMERGGGERDTIRRRDRDTKAGTIDAAEGIIAGEAAPTCHSFQAQCPGKNIPRTPGTSAAGPTLPFAWRPDEEP